MNSKDFDKALRILYILFIIAMLTVAIETIILCGPWNACMEFLKGK